MAKEKDTTETGKAPATPPMPPAYPSFLETPMGQRLAQMQMSTSGELPLWAKNAPMTAYSNNSVFPNLLSQTGQQFPGSPAPMPGPLSSPAPRPMKEAPIPNPTPLGESSAVPVAGMGSLGDDIRSDISRQIYRTGKRSDTPAGPALMNIGRPEQRPVDPLASLNQASDTESVPPRYLDSSGNTSPPSGNIVPGNSYGSPTAPSPTPSRAGPAGRLAERMQGRQGPMGAVGANVQERPPMRGPAFAPIQRRVGSSPVKSRTTRPAPPRRTLRPPTR